MTKITDVAKKAGVAKSTVSNVLTGKKYVSEELRVKVLEACREMDFQPNFYASRLSKRKTNIIALLLESTQELSVYQQELICACIVEASKRRYSLLVYYESDREKLMLTLKQGMAPVDGAIIMAPVINDERLSSLENNRISCKVIGRPGVPDIGYVDVDNRQLVKDVVDKMTEIYGKDIYLVNSTSDMTISLDRKQGFTEKCVEKGINPENRITESRLRSSVESYEFAKLHMKKYSAFVTADEIMAKGVYAAIEERGLKVGKDVGVFALGRDTKHGSFEPKLSHAVQDYKELGRLAVDILLDDINGKEAKNILIGSKLVLTESTQKA